MKKHPMTVTFFKHPPLKTVYHIGYATLDKIEHLYGIGFEIENTPTHHIHKWELSGKTRNQTQVFNKPIVELFYSRNQANHNCASIIKGPSVERDIVKHFFIQDRHWQDARDEVYNGRRHSL